jgi:hypothetical protein
VLPGLLFFCAAQPAKTAPAAPQTGTVALKPDANRRGNFTLKTEDSTLAQIAAACEVKFGCVVEVDKSLRAERLTLALSSRQPGQIFPALARRVGARLELLYRLTPLPPGALPRPGASLFAEQEVQVVSDGVLELEEVWQQLRIPIEVEEPLRRKVRLSTAPQPLHRLLDRIAAQVQARWNVVVRLQEIRAQDEEADAQERMRAHFQVLSYLSPAERQEEIAAHLDRLAALDEKRRPAGIAQLRAEILSLGSLLQGVPGEHRGRIGAQVRGVAQDYARVLERQKGKRRALFQPLSSALEELQAALADL